MFQAPFQVDFDITLECVFSCRHCNVDAGERLPDEMSMAQIMGVLDQLFEVGVCDLSITGGEPLLRRGVLDILRHAASLGGFNRFILNTNGLFVTEELVAFLEENCPTILVSVSLDGASPTAYGRLRRPRSDPDRVPDREFARVLDGLRLLAQSKLKTGVNYTVTRATIDDFYPTYHLIRGLGVKDILAIKFFPHGAGRRHLDELELPYPMWRDFLVGMTERRLGLPEYEGLQLSTLCPWEIYVPLLERGYDETTIEKTWVYMSPLKSELYRRDRDLGCHAGVTSCAISPNGDVYPCGTISSHFEPLVCGNLQKQSFDDIWRDSPILKALRGTGLDDLRGHCPECGYKHLCGGGCRLRAFTMYRDLTAPDYLCPLQIGHVDPGILPAGQVAPADARP